jgi:hypothetical protein
MTTRIHRRRFLAAAAIGGAGLTILGHSRSARGYQANDKLNVALIGCGGRGTWFVDTIPRMENVVALCDVNQIKIDETFRRWELSVKRFTTSPHSWEQKAAAEYKRLTQSPPKTYADFRTMLDDTGDGIDAVVIATPDHSHAVASAAAIRAGKHVFCEKPLTRLVGESRALRQLAREHKVATSMGNQGTASGQFRRSLEIIRDGTLGEIKEVHVWNTGGGTDRQGPPEGEQPVPDYLNWDLWLGPAKFRPYHPNWTKRHLWREFGTCQLGNWASHSANLAFMALKVHELWLNDPPAGSRLVVKIEAQCPGINRLSFPKWEIVKWHIPARADLPPITINWYNGPSPEARNIIPRLLVDGPVPTGQSPNSRLEFAGAVFVGTKGRLHTTGHNATFRLLPQDEFRDVETERPQTVDRSRGHEGDWFIACRGGKPAWANFDYASALNEFLMLGNVATQFEDPLEFEPPAMKIVNNAEADGLLKFDYRAGWSL